VILQDVDDSSRKYTYTDLNTKVTQLGRHLMSSHDVNKGDVICLVAQNDVDTPLVMLAAFWAGAIVSPANPQYTVDELEYQLRDSKAKVVIADCNSLTRVQKACTRVGISHGNIILEGPRNLSASGPPHWTDIIKHKIDTTDATRPQISPRSDLAYLVYSSGTTGKPKGVRLSHYNVTSNILQAMAGECNMLSWNGSRGDTTFPPSPAGDSLIACLPFYHIYGLTLLIQVPLYLGLRILVMAKFELEKWCRLVQEHKVSLGFIVPPIAVLLANHPSVSKYDLSSIRICTSGAAPLGKSLIDACHARTGIRIKQGYGLSETSPVLCAQRWHDWNGKAGCVGQLVPNIEAKFCEIGEFDDVAELSEVLRGQPGELYVRGPNIFLGYHNNAAATAECLDSQGWFRTGDVGHLDSQGNLYITDRVKELVKYKGYQVAPAELEGCLHKHELVEDVVVVGVDSKTLSTEVPRAYVVRKGGMAAVREGEGEEMVRWLAERLAPHKRLRGGVKFVDSIPKSPTGKILRRIVRDAAKKEYKMLEEGGMRERL
jgi:4-coumarate--CoA ligase